MTELGEVIGGIKNETPSRSNDISLRILKNLPLYTLDTSIIMINESFHLGIFPCFSLVMPLHRGGDATTPSNFRPISLNN